MGVALFLVLVGVALIVVAWKGNLSTLLDGLK